MPTLVKVQKWGNGLGLRLPKAFIQQYALTVGTTIDLDSLISTPPRPRRRSPYELKPC